MRSLELGLALALAGCGGTQSASAPNQSNKIDHAQSAAPVKATATVEKCVEVISRMRQTLVKIVDLRKSPDPMGQARNREKLLAMQHTMIANETLPVCDPVFKNDPRIVQAVWDYNYQKAVFDNTKGSVKSEEMK